MNRWQRYWFAPGGRYSAAAVRIAIALSVLWTLSRMTAEGYVAEPHTAPLALYRPLGVLLLLGSSPPPFWLIEGMKWVGLAATLAMLVGWRTRAATVVSWVCVGGLACFEVAFSAGWSHHNNLPFLAQLAFFGARGGDVWSVDAWLGRRRAAGRGGPFVDDVPGGYQWSLRLVQIAVALMFFSASLSKWHFGGFSLSWALSDNLRHQLLARFDWIGAPRTEVASWLIDDVWRYRAAAMLNLLAQTLPITTWFLMGRPRLRAFLGTLFVVETLALGFVMSLWNVHWLPLVVVFYDVDALRAWWLRRRGEAKRRDAAASSSDSTSGAKLAPAVGGGPPPRARLIGAFVAIFLLYDLAVILKLDQWPRTYPFSAFPMFGYVRAKRPYDQHQTYEMPGISIEILSKNPPTPGLQAWIDRHHTYRMMFRLKNLKLEGALTSMVTALQREEPGAEVYGARLHFAVFQAPAYPAPAALRRERVGVIGEIREGHVVSALGSARFEGRSLVFAPKWVGREPPAQVRYEALVDYELTPRPLAVTSEGGSLRAPRPEGEVVLVLAVVDGVRYVVNEAGKRRW